MVCPGNNPLSGVRWPLLTPSRSERLVFAEPLRRRSESS